MSTPTHTEASENQSKSTPESNGTTTKNDAPGVDSELDAILDSALADFDKPNVATQPSQRTAAVSDGATAEGDGKEGASCDKPNREAGDQDSSIPEEMNYDFLADAMTKQFEECFSSLIQDPAVKKQFEDLSKSAEDAASSNNPAAFADSVEKALAGLSLNAENLQTQAEPDQQEMMWERLAETLASEGVGPDEAGVGGVGGVGGGLEGGGLPSMEGLGAMGGMFQSMVQQLLSKELLYQPLKDVTVKYREYLDKNAASLEADTVSTYQKQLKTMDLVVEHLDGDSDQHSQEEKNQRFETLLELLQKMHELGNPPKEVVGEDNLMPNLPDLAGMAGFPGLSGIGNADPSKCCLM